MSAKQLSFADDMWDGIEVIKERTEGGMEGCRDILDFFKRYAAIEDEYVKNVQRLLQRYQHATVTTTLSQGWKGAVQVLEGNASVHKSLSSNILSNLCNPLQALLKDMDNRKKQLVTDGNKQKTDLANNTDLMKKAKARYELKAKELEAAKNELFQAKLTVSSQNPQTAVISRIDKKIQAAEGELATAEAQYKQQLIQYNNFIDTHNKDKWPTVLTEFEQFELMRISFMKSNIHNFLGLLKEMPSVLEQEVQTGMKHTENVDPEKDLQTFIEANKTSKELSPFVSFDQYQEQIGTVRAKSQSISRPISKIWENLRGSKLLSDEDVKLLFGLTLGDLMDKQAREDPNSLIPKILSSLTEAIIAINGLSTEGIFRLAGSASEIQNVRKQLEKGDYSVLNTVQDVHVLGTIYKQFLRELPEAVIPTVFYEDCVNGRLTPVDVLNRLPPVHKHVLLYIVNFLQLFMKPAYVKTNKMNSANLSTIFATILLRSPQKDPSALLAGLTSELGFVEKLIISAPPLDPNLFPLLAGLHKDAASTAFSPPTSPSNLASSTSSLGDVAYSSTASIGSFEDVSNPPSHSDFSEEESGADGKFRHPLEPDEY